MNNNICLHSPKLALPTLLGALVFSVCSSTEETPLPPLPDLPEMTREAFMPQVREQIETAFRTVVSSPEDADANGHLGMILQAYEHFGLAKDCYRRALTLDNREFRWAYYLGVVEARLGNHEEAVKSLNQALQQKSNDLPAQVQLAESLFNTHQLDRSRSIYERLIRNYPNLAIAHYGLGQVQAFSGQTEAAIQSYQKACGLSPGAGAPHYGLALAYRTSGMPEKAQQHFSIYQQTHQLKPRFQDPLLDSIMRLGRGAQHYFETAQQLEAEARFEEAAAKYERALELEPGLSQGHVNLIHLYTGLGEYRKAEEHYRACLETDPNLAELHYNFGLLRALQQQYQEAMKFFQTALEINPYYADAHMNLGAMLQELERMTEAEQHFRLALKNNPGHRLAHFNLGRVLQTREEYGQAIDHLLQTITVQDEKTPVFLYMLADTYARLGNNPAAFRHAQEAIQQARSQGQTELAEEIEGVVAELGRGTR